MDTAGTRGTITAIEDEAATDIAIEARRELLLLLLCLPTSSPSSSSSSSSNKCSYDLCV